jgi:hypothetical protein
MAYVRAFRPSKWLPRTVWDGCTVLEPGRPKFVVLRYLVRGAFVVDTDLMDLSGKRYYLDDMIDADMILRCGS